MTWFKIEVASSGPYLSFEVADIKRSINLICNISKATHFDKSFPKLALLLNDHVGKLIGRHLENNFVIIAYIFREYSRKDQTLAFQSFRLKKVM